MRTSVRDIFIFVFKDFYFCLNKTYSDFDKLILEHTFKNITITFTINKTRKFFAVYKDCGIVLQYEYINNKFVKQLKKINLYEVKDIILKNIIDGY